MDMAEFARRAEEIKDRLYRTAYLYLGDVSASDEALSEAVYKGLCACGRLRQEEYFTTWMTRILINVCRDELKRRRREGAVEELPETAAESFDALPLRQAVAALPGELKDVVLLRYFAGYTLRQTAEILGIPQGTAATRQRRALALLRLDLGEEE